MYSQPFSQQEKGWGEKKRIFSNGCENHCKATNHLNPSIRPAEKADLPAVLHLYAQPEFDNGSVLSLAQAEALFERMQCYPDYQLYVAEMDWQIVGTFALLIMDNLGHLGAPSGVVEDVAVDPVWQSQGIGTAMMRWAIDYCRDKGCYKLALSSNLKRGRTHAFYEALGFKRHGYSFLMDLQNPP